MKNRPALFLKHSITAIIFPTFANAVLNFSDDFEKSVYSLK